MALNSLFNGKKLNLFSLVFSFIIIYLLIGIYNIQALNQYSIPIYSSNQSAMVKNPTFSLFGLTTNEIELKMNCNAFISGSGDSVCSYYAPLGNLIATGGSSLSNYCVNFGEYNYQNVQNIDNIESSYFITSSASTFYGKIQTDLIINADNDYLIFFQDVIKDDLNHVKNFLSNSSFETEVANLPDWTNRTFDLYNDLSKCSTYVLQPEELKGSSWGCDGGGDASWRTYYYMRIFPFNSSEIGLVRYNITKTANVCSVKSGGSCASGYEIGYFEKGESKTIITTGLVAEGELTLNPNSHYVFYIANYISGKGDGIGVGSCSVSEGDYETEFNITIITPDWDCSLWSNCDNGSQYRECNDLTGKLPDKLETRFCYVAPENWVDLGFEDYTTVNVWYNYFSWFCQCSSEIKEVLYPNGWNIVNPNIRISTLNNKTGYQFDFLKMTSEMAYEGDKSLKMWNIPPQLRIPEPDTFIELLNTYETGFLDASNNTNEGWTNPENAYLDNNYMFAVGEAYENVSYLDFNFGDVPDGCTSIINLTVRLDTNKGGSPDTVVYDCIKIKINNTWSSCESIGTLTVAETTYLRYFGTFANNYAFCDLDDFEVRLNLTSGSGDVELDYVSVVVEFYNPQSIALYENMLCGNQTVGVFPDVYQNIDTDENDSIFVERNITLPTPFMSASFKVRKCLEPELKFYATPICLDFTDNCYTTNEDCNVESKGKITFYLKDAITNEFLYDITSDVIYPNKWEIREYAIDSLQPNYEYTLGFAVLPESTVDPNYYCIYLDDVNIDIRNQALICVSDCDEENNEIKRYCKEYDENNNCLVCEQIAIINSPNCHSSQTVINKIESCESYCGCEELPIGNSNYYTYYTTKLIEDCNITLYGIESCCDEYEKINNSDRCIEYCDTQKLKDTVSDIVADRLEDAGLGFLVGFVSAMFIILSILMVIAGAFAYKLDKSWQVFAMVLIIELVITSFLWLDFAFIGILIAVILALFLTKMYLSKN